MTKLLNAALITLLVAPVAGPVPRNRQTRRTADTARARGDAAWRDGLHAQAVAAGGHYYHVTSFDSELQFGELDTLFHRSDVVVFGDILESESHISKNGDYVTTDYRMRAQQVFKGDLLPSSVVVVEVVGGKYVFDDGTDVQLETQGFARPLVRDRVVIFGKIVNGGDWLSPGVLNYAGGMPILLPTALSRGVLTVPIQDTDRVRVNALSARDQMSHTLRVTTAGALISALHRLSSTDKRH